MEMQNDYTAILCVVIYVGTISREETTRSQNLENHSVNIVIVNKTDFYLNNSLIHSPCKIH
jgi:hypothetical protein